MTTTTTRLASDTGDHIYMTDEAAAHKEAAFYAENGHPVSLVAGEGDGWGFDVYDLWNSETGEDWKGTEYLVETGQASQVTRDAEPTEAERQALKTLINAEYAGGVQYRGGVYPALEPGQVIDINSLYPTTIELPSTAECPIHGAGCEAWA